MLNNWIVFSYLMVVKENSIKSNIVGIKAYQMSLTVQEISLTYNKMFTNNQDHIHQVVSHATTSSTSFFLVLQMPAVLCVLFLSSARSASCVLFHHTMSTDRYQSVGNTHTHTHTDTLTHTHAHTHRHTHTHTLTHSKQCNNSSQSFRSLTPDYIWIRADMRKTQFVG